MQNTNHIALYIDALRLRTTELIISSQSIPDGEKADWLSFIPLLPQDVLERLYTTLLNESIMLKRIEEQYEQDIARYNEEQRIAFEDFARLAP